MHARFGAASAAQILRPDEAQKIALESGLRGEREMFICCSLCSPRFVARSAIVEIKYKLSFFLFFSPSPSSALSNKISPSNKSPRHQMYQLGAAVPQRQRLIGAGRAVVLQHAAPHVRVPEIRGILLEGQLQRSLQEFHAHDGCWEGDHYVRQRLRAPQPVRTVSHVAEVDGQRRVCASSRELQRQPLLLCREPP